jgi:hypothetical protein
MPLLGQRPERLRQHLDLVGAHRDLARPGAEERALHSCPVADVEQLVTPELIPELVGAEVHLDLAAAVEQMSEAGLAVSAKRDDPPGDSHLLTRLGGHLIAARLQLRRVMRGLVAVGVRLDAERSPLSELLAPLTHQLVEGHATANVGSARRQVKTTEP